MRGHITGVGWREQELSFEIRDEEKELVPVRIGDEIAFAVSEPRRCIGYRPPGSASLQPCPHNRVGIGGHQCEECILAADILPCLRCDGDRCRNPARRKDCVQPANHALYLASFAPGVIKVGVARWQRRFERLAEQGARAALIVARDDGQMIRRHETMIRKFGYPDRLQLSEKLHLLTLPASQEELESELREALGALKHRMRAPWLKPAETLELPTQPLFVHTPRIVSPHQGMTLRGIVQAITGQTLIIHTDSNETVAIEGSALTGYKVEELAVEQGSSGQLSLALM